MCGGAFGSDGGALRCPAGHSFDIARQGHVNLLAGARPVAAADTAEMVAARSRFLAAGHYGEIAAAVAQAAADSVATTTKYVAALEVGAGTGYYLAATLDRLPHAHGIAMDLSPAAAKRAARCHQRADAVVWDVWRPLPLVDASIDLVLDVFAPRNAEEFRRVLRPGGHAIVVTPSAAHLREVIEPLGLLNVDDRKDERLHTTMGEYFTVTGRRGIERTLSLPADAVADLVRMGPSAHHRTEDDVRAGVDALGAGGAVEVTVDVVVTTFQRSS